MELNYTACVLKETLRLYPPVWLFSRRARKEDQLGEFRIPAGAHIFIAPYFLHRRPELWPNPERFDPDRFDESRSPPVDRYAFIPFSAGARRCIGDYFSYVEMQMHLALLAPHFALRLQPDQSIQLDPAVNLRTHHSINLTVQHRTAT
jgi:cytochrome P450